MNPIQKRRGFTTIELLVVIAIMAVLAAMIYAAINRVRTQQFMVTTQSDIREFELALEEFKGRYGMYPPSSITVGTSKGAIPASDYTILTTIWPSIDLSQAFGASGMQSGTYRLKGDQCLVLFLGGLHDQRGCVGFSTNPQNPFEADTNKPDRKQPLFKFKPERLHQREAGKPFFSYGDGWFGQMFKDKTTGKVGQSVTCYAYFSAQKGVYADTDCDRQTDRDGTGNFPHPFRHPTKKDAFNNLVWVNPNSFQIISAGADTFFGGATMWAPNDNSDVGKNPTSTDNVTNFSGGILGS